MKKRASYDYYLILATTVVLFCISGLCLYGMFAFKAAQVQNLPIADKQQFMAGMNTAVAPFVVALILLLGICVPKRLLPVHWLNYFAVFLLIIAMAVGTITNINTSLLVVLTVALILQIIVLALALAGSARLHFEKNGYWVRVGSSLVHLGLIFFIFDLFLYHNLSLHLILFWVTTLATVLGMLFCFYADFTSKLATKIWGSKNTTSP